MEEETTTASSAVEKVFNIAELLEAILLDVPCRDVLLSQRVAKCWEVTITESKKLRGPLCFVPEEESERLAGDENPGLRDFYKQFSARDYHAHIFDRDDQGKTYTKERPRPHPFLTALCPKHEDCKSLFEYTNDQSNILADSRNDLLRDMPALRPTFQEVSVVVKRRSEEDGHVLRSVGVLRAEEGVTVGHVFDHLETEDIVIDALADDESCCFGLICDGVHSYVH